MIGRLRPHLTYANVVATLALFIALSGAGAYAASQIPRKSVGAPQLRTGAVTANKLRKNAVTTPKVRAKAITVPKLATDAVDSRVLAPGAVGNDKLAYQAITNDKVGPNSIDGTQVIESTLSQVPSAGAANTAVSAESAQPVAFAKVEANGNVSTGSSKGIAAGNVKTAAGTYCLSVPGFIPRGAQVSGESITTEPVIANVAIPGSCGFPSVEVQTFDFDEGVARFGKADRAFFVVFYR